jgi:hypothetical protein
MATLQLETLLSDEKLLFQKDHHHLEQLLFLLRLGLEGGFDHGVGHPLLLLYNAKAPNCRKNKAFNGLGHYSEWPKVADAVIKAWKARFPRI